MVLNCLTIHPDEETNKMESPHLDPAHFDPERMAASSAFDSQMPVWAKVMGYLGFPVVVASSLLWVFTDQIRSERTILIEHNEVMKKHADVAFQQYVSQMSQGTATLRTLSQICANGAKTELDRKECAVAVITPAPILLERH